MKRLMLVMLLMVPAPAGGSVTPGTRIYNGTTSERAPVRFALAADRRSVIDFATTLGSNGRCGPRTRGLRISFRAAGVSAKGSFGATVQIRVQVRGAPRASARVFGRFAGGPGGRVVKGTVKQGRNTCYAETFTARG